jgi:hypothetical protein
MDELRLEVYWDEIPVGKDKACTYADLCATWGMNERQVRKLLHELSVFDNGDNYILIRSASGKGFYRTDDAEEIKAYKKECLSKGRSVFAPIRKINRVLNVHGDLQYSFENNLRVIRESKGMTQGEVCKQMKKYDNAFDNSLLSKMENGIAMPTPYQTILLAQIYGCTTSELLTAELYH